MYSVYDPVGASSPYAGVVPVRVAVDMDILSMDRPYTCVDIALRPHRGYIHR